MQHRIVTGLRKALSIAPFMMLIITVGTLRVEAITVTVPGAVPKPAGFVISPPWADGIEHTITQAYDSGFHKGTDQSCCNNDYYALDFDLQLDEDVYAVAPGKVSYAGPATGPWKALGNIVFVDHQNGYQSVYAHLNSVNVTYGETVSASTVLGGAGGSGGWPVHLHFALYRGANLYHTTLGTGQYGGQAVLPEPFSRCSEANAKPCEDLVTGTHLWKASTVAPVDFSSGPITLSWRSPAVTRSYEIQVTPMFDDGPAIDLVISDLAMVRANSFSILAPKLDAGNYILLPGSYYSWKVRFSSVAQPLGSNDPSWGPWSSSQWFRTPLPTSRTIRILDPAPSSIAATATPTIRWLDSSTTDFYYEIQVSADPWFRLGSDAVAPVYWNLVHGGMTTPSNSWKVPSEFSLDPGTYYVRVRQRVQATPAGSLEQGITWTPTTRFVVK